MATPPRIEIVGASYHVNIKAVTGVHAFPDNLHRERFLALLRDEVTKSAWTCLGYTILGTHHHVIIKLNKPTLSSGFQRLNSRYARWFNRRHGRTGAMWQARFFDVLIESAYQFLEAQYYLAHNATRARLVERPEDWQYCHYGATVGMFPRDALVDEDSILRLLSENRRVARRRFQAYVDEPDRRTRLQMFLRGTSDHEKRAWALVTA